MKQFIKSVFEDLDGDLSKLRDLELMPKEPMHARISKLKRDFESDDAIAKAIEDFENAASAYIDRNFSNEDQRSTEFTNWRRFFAQDCKDLEKRTWIEWFWTH
jgi:hypothetical protein